MALLKFLVCFLLFLCNVRSEDDHDHHEGDEHDHNVLHEIGEALGASEVNETFYFKFYNFQTLYGEIFRNCSGVEKTSCQLCLTADDLFEWKTLDKAGNYTHEAALELFSGALYMLLPEAENASAVCKSQEVMHVKSNRTDQFQYLLNKYGGHEGKLTESGLEELLHEINETIGLQLTDSKCFSVDDVIKAANISEEGAGEHEFEYASTYILWKLFGKHCISDEHGHEEHSDLPKPEFFWTQVSSKYSSNGSFSEESLTSLIKALGIGGNSSGTDSHGSHSDGDSHAGHDHRKRRSVFIEHAGSSRQKRSTHEEAFKSKCFSSDEILKIFSIEHDALVSKQKFEQVCPSLIQQIESGLCKTTSSKSDHEETDKWKPWVATIISILIISLASLSGVFMAPLNKRKWFTSLLMFLISLAISTLIGDASLHLFPHALDLHKHEDGDHSHSDHDVLGSDSYLWKCVALLAGIYGFYLFELLMHAFRKGHSHSHGLEESHRHVGRGNSHKPIKGTIELNENPSYTRRTSSVIRGRPSGLHDCESHSSDASFEDQDHGIAHKHSDEIIKNANANEDGTVIHYNNGSQHIQVSSPAKSDSSNRQLVDDQSRLSTIRSKVQSLQAVVWMVLIGDAVHNFMDGLAIGVAFSEDFPDGLHGGISTSIAILCHELPHELGDFAVLLNTGVSIKLALLLNFISSLTALIGGVVGVAIGTLFSGSGFVFAITGGMFFYIALVDMLPEVLHSGLVKKHPLRSLTIQNLGLWIGFSIMFVLAVYEEDLKTALK